MKRRTILDITFINTFSTPEEVLTPQPAGKLIPEWYRNSSSYLEEKKKPDGEGKTTGTIKRCMPVFDAITSGYLILLPTDVWVSKVDGEPYFQWPHWKAVEFHPVQQAPQHPLRKSFFSYPKWINPWAIITPKNYSCLFTQPSHHDLPFTIFPGVVDTDRYHTPVNFPFVINDLDFEGVIPKGTPIAQVIPIYRNKWEMKTVIDSEVGYKSDKTHTRTRTKIFDSYKTQFWNKKEYK